MRSPASGICSFCHVANLLDTSKVSVAFKTQKMRTRESHVGAARVLLALGVKGSGEHYRNGHGCAGWRSWLSQQSDCQCMHEETPVQSMGIRVHTCDSSTGEAETSP